MSFRTLCSAGTLVLVLTLTCFTLKQQHVSAQVMDAPRARQWEYKTAQGMDVRLLNSVGSKGWELVTVWTAPNGNVWCVFKRPQWVIQGREPSGSDPESL